MKPNHLQASWLLLGASILLLAAWTLLEARLTGMSPAAERVVTFLLLVLPPAAGAFLAGWSLVRREGRTGLAIAAMIFNLAFALFHFLGTEGARKSVTFPSQNCHDNDHANSTGSN